MISFQIKPHHIILLFATFLFFSSLAKAQRKLAFQSTVEGKIPIPPDGIWLKDNLFIDASELANIHWLEFYFYAKEADSLAVDSLQLSHSLLEWEAWPDMDSMHYISKVFQYAPPPKDLFNYEKGSVWLQYADHPVVGVSYEQVLAYSQWRSMVVTKHLNEQLANLGDTMRVLVHYRLPTEDEWMLAAQYSSINEIRAFTKKEGRALNRDIKELGLGKVDWQNRKRPEYVSDFLIVSEDSIPVYIEGVNMLGGAKKGKLNGLGIYHLLGNVAEMTATKGLAKGGSWMHPPEECNKDDWQFYECPSEWLGFRNIAEVYTYHKDSMPPEIH